MVQMPFRSGRFFGLANIVATAGSLLCMLVKCIEIFDDRNPQNKQARESSVPIFLFNRSNNNC